MKLKTLYNKKCKIAQLNLTLSIELDKEIERYLGFDLDNLEMDFAVDTLNEGYGGLSFNDFMVELNILKKNFMLKQKEVKKDE